MVAFWAVAMYTGRMKDSWLDRIGARPTRTILGVYWIVQISVGMLILSPFYRSETDTPALAVVLIHPTALKAYGVALVFPGIISLYALFRKKWRWSQKVVRFGAFWTFLLFTYFTLARLIAFGPQRVVWFTYALCSMTMGIAYLRLKWEDS